MTGPARFRVGIVTLSEASDPEAIAAGWTHEVVGEAWWEDYGVWEDAGSSLARSLGEANSKVDRRAADNRRAGRSVRVLPLDTWGDR